MLHSADEPGQVKTVIDLSHMESHYAFFYGIAAAPVDALFFSDTRGHCIRKWTQQGVIADLC